MILDNTFFDIYAEIKDELFENIKNRTVELQISDIDNNIRIIAGMQYKEYYEAVNTGVEIDIDECNDWINEQSETDVFKIFEFMLAASITLYFGDSNTNDYLKSNNIFGYSNCFSVLKSFFGLTNREKSSLSKNILSNLQSTNRECNIVDYITNNYYVDDAKLIKEYMSDTDDKSDITDNELYDAITSVFTDDIYEKVEAIVNVYKKMLDADFGLKRYKAVMTLSNDKTNALIGITTKDGTRSVKTDFPESAIIGANYVPILRQIVPNLKTVNDRQFTHDKILDQYFDFNGDKILYFPKKILELTSLSRITSSNSTNNGYSSCSSIKESSKLAKFRTANQNLNKYIEYLRYKMEQEVANFCVEACDRAYSKLDKSLKSKYSEIDAMTDPDFPKMAEFRSKVMDAMAYFVKCVTSAVILVDCATTRKKLGDKESVSIAAFRIKVSYNTMDRTGRESTLLGNRQFCAMLSERLHGNVNVLASKNPVDGTTDTKDIYGNHMIDYSYTFDAAKAFARPVFAYKALEELRVQGRSPEWDQMLLGENPDGSICFSGKDNKINLQSGSVHMLFAGSRSGKGVMCFNIFATAIASQIPIFYCDRKPDTAITMAQLAKNMFAVNGGAYDPDIDYDGFYDEDRLAKLFRIPSYLSNYIAGNDRFDLVYFRAILLIMLLIEYVETGSRFKEPNQVAIYEQIRNKLSRGMVIVLDEFTNFAEKFLRERMTTGGNGWFKNAVSDNRIKNFKNDLFGIQDGIAKDEKKNKGGGDYTGNTESAVDKAKEFPIEGVYFAALANRYENILSEYVKIFNAGGGEFIKRKVQYFIIGQQLPTALYGSEMKFTRSTAQRGGVQKFKGDMIGTPLWGFFEKQMTPDYILGYQGANGLGDPSYLAQGETQIISNSYLNASRRCFTYHKPKTPYNEKTIYKITSTREYMKNDSEINKFLTDEFTYFKPYLILNNAVVPPEELLYNDGSDPEIGDKRQGKTGKPEYKKSQFVGQCITNCERAGLTWDDLKSDNPSPDGTTLNDGVGFDGYITKLCGSLPTESLNASGDVMNLFVQNVLGYKDGGWLEFLFDFRPEAMFGADDFFKPVTEKLKDSFFMESLTIEKSGYSFSKIFEDKLGTLLPYYATIQSVDSSEELTDDNTDFEEDIEDDTGTRRGIFDTNDEDDEEINFGDDDDEDISFGDDESTESEATSNWAGNSNNYTIPFKTVEEYARAKMQTDKYSYKRFLDSFVRFYIEQADGGKRSEARVYWNNYNMILNEFHNYLVGQENRLASKGIRPGTISGYLQSLMNNSSYNNEIESFMSSMTDKMIETDRMLNSATFNSNNVKNEVIQGIHTILKKRLTAMYRPFFKIMFKLRGHADADAVADQAMISTFRNFGL